MGEKVGSSLSSMSPCTYKGLGEGVRTVELGKGTEGTRHLRVELRPRGRGPGPGGSKDETRGLTTTTQLRQKVGTRR